MEEPALRQSPGTPGLLKTEAEASSERWSLNQRSDLMQKRLTRSNIRARRQVREV